MSSSYAHVTKGYLTHSQCIKAVHSQFDLEFGRPLSLEEEKTLFQTFSPKCIVERIQKYGYGSIKFLLMLAQRPEMKCDVSPNATPRDGNCLFSAISDGILNNDAFKHNDNEERNDSWTNLIKEYKYFDEEINNHTKYLRERFVNGAKEWMAGKNGSQQDDKSLFGYSDSEWELIWTKMLEDGAWDAPSIKDKDGNVVKENFAPEILIKYIAHELRANIVVFDLKLQNIQFLSGNHVKKNNVLFKSPLLLYSTGNHFQTLFQVDHEYFIKYTEEKNNELEGKIICKDSFNTSKKREIPKKSVDEYNWEQMNSAKRRKHILEERERENTHNVNARHTGIPLRKGMDTAQVLVTDDQESIWRNIFSCKENISNPQNDLYEEQRRQILTAFDASVKLIENYKHIRKANISFLEQKFLKKARYNIARLSMLYPYLVCNKRQESTDVGQKTQNCSNQSNWIKVMKERRPSLKQGGKKKCSTGLKLSNRFMLLSKWNDDPSMNANQKKEDETLSYFCSIGKPNIFKSKNTRKKHCKKIKESIDESITKESKKKLYLPKYMNDNYEENIGKIIDVFEILASKKRNLKKCRTCHFKSRKCIIDPATCKAKNVKCKHCQNIGHLPKSIVCQKRRKLVKNRKNIKDNRKEKEPRCKKVQIDKINMNLIHQRIYEIEKGIKRNLIKQRIFEALKTQKKERKTVQTNMKKEMKKGKEESRNNDKTKIRNRNEYACILFFFIIFCLPTIVFGQSIAISTELIMCFLPLIAISIVLCLGICFICCLRKNNNLINDIEKYELEKLIDTETNEQSSTTSYVIENDHHFSSNQYMDPATINPSFIEIANCSHYRLLIDFDKQKNVNEAMVLNRALHKAYSINTDEIDDYLSKIEGCVCHLHEKITGSGKEKKNENKDEKTVGMKNVGQKSCSLISIILSLFNLKIFRNSMNKIQMGKKWSLCKVGSCEFCLILSLYNRYKIAKRQIEPKEILGLKANINADNTSIDNVYKILMDSLRHDVQNFHADMDAITNMFTPNLDVLPHETCGNKPDMSNNLIYNMANEHVGLDGFSSDCVCSEVIENDYYWKNKDGLKLAIICEKNVKKKGLTRILDIDGDELELASLITKEADHFKCIVPNFKKGWTECIDEKVVRSKQTNGSYDGALYFYENFETGNYEEHVQAQSISYSKKQLLYLDKVKHDVLKDKKRIYNEKNRDKITEKHRIYNEQNKAEIIEKQRIYNEQNKAEIIEKQRIYDEQNKAKIIEKQRIYDEQNKAKIIEKQRIYNEQNKAKIIEKQRKYDKKNKDIAKEKRDKENKKVSFQFNKVMKAKKTSISLSKFCQVCNFLKTSDSVQTFPTIQEVPLKYRVLMSSHSGQQVICFYCKSVLGRGRIPVTNEYAFDLSQSRFINTTLHNEQAKKIEAKFLTSISSLGKFRYTAWSEGDNEKHWEYISNQCNDKVKADICFIAKGVDGQKRIELVLGYLTLVEMCKLVIIQETESIFDEESKKLSQAGICHLIKNYFVHLFKKELEFYSDMNRHLIFNDVSLLDTDNLLDIHHKFAEEFIDICQEILPAMYEEKETLQMDIEAGKRNCTTDSSLVQHLIKLIIPFQRVFHLPRGYSFKIKGPCINVPATVQRTVNKLLPQNLNNMLTPVALKRKLSYISDYIFQEIKTEKVIEIFKILKYKFKNPHYKNVSFSQRMLEEDVKSFVSNCRNNVKKLEKNGEIDDEESKKRLDPESDEDEDLISVAEDIGETIENIENYDGKFLGDSLMIPLDRPALTGSSLADAVATQIEKQGVFIQKNISKRQQRRRKKLLKKLNIAPGEDNIPTDWSKDKFLEEKAFPHLFLSGQGGFVSTYKNKMKFSTYFKMRLYGKDPAFRKNFTYIFFLLCIKERINVRSMNSIFFRKAFKGRQLSAKKLKSMNLADLQKSDASYNIYRNLRGSPPFFQSQKKRCLAMLRQLGKPNLFATFSAAEKHWSELVEEIFNTLTEEEKITTYKSETFAGLSDPMKNRMIQDNVVLTCNFFHRRIKKILSYLRSEAYVLNGFRVKDFFYRIEFQARGSPHVHMLLWLENEDGKSPEEAFSKQKDLTKWLDSIISSDIPSDTSDYKERFLPNFEKHTGMTIADLQEKATLFQQHNHTFTCRKRKGKKCKALKVRKEEGYAMGQKEIGSEITQMLCRFNFPQFPMDKTTLLTPLQDNEQKTHSKNLLKIKKYLIRQMYIDQTLKDPESRLERFKKLSFDEMLKDLGLSRNLYVSAIRTGIVGKQKVFHQRSPKNLFVNNYNPELLMINQANMDFTFVSDEYACVAYILGYLTKDESQMSEALKQVDQSVENNKDVKKKLEQFEAVFDRNREASIQEAVWRLLGLDMVAGSRKLKVIVAREPKFRDGLLKPMTKKDEDVEMDDSEIFIPGIFEHYSMRPYILEKLCLADFAAYFEFSTQSGKKLDSTNFFADDNEDEMINSGFDKDCADDFLNQIPPGTEFKLLGNSGYIKKRKFRCILNYRRDKSDATENARSTLLLFKSWRDEESEIHSADFKSLLKDNEDEITTNQIKYEKFASIFEQLDDIEQKIKETEETGYSKEDEDDDIEYENENEMEVDLFEKESTRNTTFSTAKDEETTKLEFQALKEQVRSLNCQQRAIVDEFIERCSLPVGAIPPTLLHIVGSAGTGKSYLLKALISVTKFILERNFVSLDPDQPVVQIGAPTNNSAFQIGGQTIHSLLGFGYDTEDSANNVYKNINGEMARDLPFRFANTRMLFLDEVSMIGSNMMSKISLRLQEILNIFPGWNTKSFGGLDLVVLGDFFQLPPILDRFCFKNSTLRGRCPGLSLNHYTKNVRSYFLTEKVRSSEDAVFGDLCDRIATNSITKNDSKLLEGRCDISCPGEDQNESYKNGDIQILALENKRINEINSEFLENVNKNNQSHEFIAKDKFNNLSEPVSNVSLNYTETGNLPTKLTLKVDTPVILTKNINKKDRLVNGKLGSVHEIDEQNKIIWVNFHEENVGKIARYQSQFKPKKPSSTAVPIMLWKSSVSFQQFGKRKGGAVVSRCNQFPLAPSYATTVHKSQGSTLKNVINDFKQNSKRPVPCGAFYTAITRVKTLANVFLRNFERHHIRTDPDVIEEIKRLKTVPYKFIKPYLRDPVFRNCKKEVKVSYLNCNGILSSLEDIKADFNLMESDILCLAEAKIMKNIPNKKLDIDNFEICCRLDGKTENSGGMVVYVRETKREFINMIKKQQTEGNNIEKIILEYCGINICFIYFNPIVTRQNMDSLKTLTGDLANHTVIMGDFNLRPECVEEKKKLESLFPEHQIFIKASTFHRGDVWSSLDHILVHKKYQKPIVTASYKNIYSDHASINIRLAMSDQAETIAFEDPTDVFYSNSEFINKKGTKTKINTDENQRKAKSKKKQFCRGEKRKHSQEKQNNVPQQRYQEIFEIVQDQDNQNTERLQHKTSFDKLDCEPDGNCFFRAISHFSKRTHKFLRKAVVSTLRSRPNLFRCFFKSPLQENYFIEDLSIYDRCRRMELDGTWAGFPERLAAACYLKINIFELYETPTNQHWNVFIGDNASESLEQNNNDCIYISYNTETRHFNPLQPHKNFKPNVKNIYFLIQHALTDAEGIFMKLDPAQLSPTHKLYQTEDQIEMHIEEQNFLNPIGLTNLGNTCYFNSLLQCLKVFPQLHSALENDLKFQANENGMIRMITNLFKMMKENANPEDLENLCLSIILNLQQEYPTKYELVMQHDPHELLADIFALINDELRSAQYTEYQTFHTLSETIDFHEKYNKSESTKLMTSYLSTHRDLHQECNQTTFQALPCMLLPFPEGQHESISMEKLAENYFMEERRQIVSCPVCGVSNPQVIEHTSMSKCPKMLILKLIRYRTDGSNNISKIMTTVSTGKVENGRIVAKLFGQDYFLKSVLFHIGTEVGGGHYTAVTHEQEKWIYLNDSIVSSRKNYIHQAYKSKDNYLFMYELSE